MWRFRRGKAELTLPPRGHRLGAYRTLATVTRSIGTDQGMNCSKPTWDEIRTRHAPKSSFSKDTLLPCSPNLTVGACELDLMAKPAKDSSVVIPTPKQGPVRTDLTPRNKNECLAVAQTLNEQARKLSQQAKRQGVSREFTRVASDLDASCGEEDFSKAWISIEWMNGCVNNFTKDTELGFCLRNEGYSCALSPRSDACSQRR